MTKPALMSMLTELEEVLGAAPRRLLKAIFESAEFGPQDADVLTAAKDAVANRLSLLETTVPSAETLRTRVTLINAAAKALGARHYRGSPPFRLRSRKYHFEVRLDSAVKHQRARLVAGDQAVRSSSEDSNISVAEMEDPRVVTATCPHFQVFLSHAHEGAAVEEVVRAFGAELNRKLASLPYKYRKRFTANLWIDHSNMKGIESFKKQTARQCRVSKIAIFLVNDRWYVSDACKEEARYFKEDRERGEGSYLLVQLSGSRLEGDPDFADIPSFPAAWRQDVANLLEAWSLPLAERDAFLTRLRTEICEALLRRCVGDDRDAEPSGPDLPKLLGNAARTQYESVIAGGQAEDPHVSPQEGGILVEDGIARLVDWACNFQSTNRVQALLGSFGSGKTTTSQLFVRHLINRRESEDDLTVPVPIYLDLRRLNGVYGKGRNAPSLPELVRASLHPDIREEVDTSYLLEFMRSERCVIVFDGLDEVGTRIGVERLAALYRTMLELIPSDAWNADREARKADWIACPTRLLVTCRTHFFRDHIEQESMLRAFDRSPGLQVLRGYNPIKTLYMAPFSPEQIYSFFHKTLGEEAGDLAFQSVALLPDLQGLAGKPIMARYISELAPDLELDAKAGRTINVAAVYGHLFRRALERDNDKQPILKVYDRQRLLERLAEHLWLTQRPSIKADELEEWFDSYAEATPGIRSALSASLNARGLLQTELRNASLLVRPQDDLFSFVHTSFFEYFLAVRILDRFIGGQTNGELPYVSWETVSFMLNMVEINELDDVFEEALGRAELPHQSSWLRNFAGQIHEARRHALTRRRAWVTGTRH